VERIMNGFVVLLKLIGGRFGDFFAE
jgi:hypothetical protein